jgi:hypothetical protein
LLQFDQGELLLQAQAALDDAVEVLYGSRQAQRINDGPDGHARILAAYTRAIDGQTNVKGVEPTITSVEERGPFILRTNTSGEPDYVQVAAGTRSTFNLKADFAQRFPTRGEAETAMREVPVELVVEPLELDARVADPTASEFPHSMTPSTQE